MQNKRNYLWISILVLLVSGCTPEIKQEEQPQAQVITPKTAITPEISSGENYYQNALPYKPSQTKGTYSALNNRLDANRLELGLMEIALTKFASNKYLFQEGQVIQAAEVEKWLGRYSSKNTQGLNPEIGSPVLLHIVEQDYLWKENQELGGIVIGLSISPYRQTKDGEIEVLPIQEQRKGVQDFGNAILERIRAKKISVPILIAGFAVTESTSLTPGTFINYGWVPNASDRFDDWKEIKESYVLYPSRSTLKGSKEEMDLQFSKFQEDIQTLFSQYAGIVGLVRFSSEEPVEMTLTVTAEYSAKSEVIALTQYIAGLIPTYFPNSMYISVYVTSIDRPEAIYVRPVKGEPFFHVYR